MGTFKLYVLDAGSGTVVRSMVSRDSDMEGWKSKGLSFYVLKSSLNAKPSMSSRSGTMNSDVFDTVSDDENIDDDDDDVSVSSFTGTDVVKRNLAEDIKR